MKKLVIILLLIALPVEAKHLHKEKEYQKVWCDANNGIMEYKLDDNTRVDCLTKKLAVEFDFAPKWSECVGQAIYYGKKTHRTPACVLILEQHDDIRYFYRLKYTIIKRKKIRKFKMFTIDKNIFN